MTRALTLLILDATWRPRHPVVLDPDWRAAMTGLLAQDCRWVALHQRRDAGAPAMPAPGDIALTRALARRLRPLGICLTDHLIHAGPSRFSFRAAGLL